MKYTEGEWKAHKISSSGYTIESNLPESDVIARVEYSQGNAHLIAATPDMYEALKALLPDKNDPLAQPPLHGKWEVDGKNLEQARLAVAKAGGK